MPTQRRHIVCIDGGSSTLKIAVYELGAGHERRLLDGGVDTAEASAGALRLRDDRDPRPYDRRLPLGTRTPLATLVSALAEAGITVDGVGHRLPFGGPTHEEPARVDDALLTALDALVEIDPLHLPAALKAVREIAALLPDVPQVACFDTAFHHRMPMVAQRLPLPRELWAAGVRRYGYHGLSYESIVRDLGQTGTRGAMIVAHLGSGASLAAMRNGKPMDTTMGFSPLGGIMMATRPGDLDPGVLLYLLRSGRCTPAELEALLTERSGLLGMSQTSADMRVLLRSRAADAAAAAAVELFVYEIKKQLGALVAVLGGLDTLVFTGGIGERSAPVRAEICAGLENLGIELDAPRNTADAGTISADAAHVVVRVIAANENLMVARHTLATLFMPA